MGQFQIGLRVERQEPENSKNWIGHPNLLWFQKQDFVFDEVQGKWADCKAGRRG